MIRMVMPNMVVSRVARLLTPAWWACWVVVALIMRIHMPVLRLWVVLVAVPLMFSAHLSVSLILSC